MSGIREHSTRESSLLQMLGRVVIATAVVALFGISALALVDRPTQTVLAEAEATATPSATATAEDAPATVTPSPTSRPTVTPTVTRVLSEPVSAPTPSVTSAPSPALHVVQEAETLSGIARTYGVSMGELVRINELANPDLLYVGQELALPRGGSDAATRESDPTPVPIQPTREPSSLSPDRTVEDRWIDVDISEQRLTAYEADTPVHTTLVSTGLPNTPTPLGEFRIWIKFRFDDMAGSDYYIEDVPYVMYFHEGYGLHGVTWHGNFGHPMSHGCVNLPTEQAEWLFGWAEVGTLVVIHE